MAEKSDFKGRVLSEKRWKEYEKGKKQINRDEQFLYEATCRDSYGEQILHAHWTNDAWKNNFIFWSVTEFWGLNNENPLQVEI